MAGVLSTRARGLLRGGVAAAAACVALGLPAAASAADPTIGSVTAVKDPTGGATVTAELRQSRSNGAVYPVVTVADTGADGLCAHGAVVWEHENGRTYTDYGMWRCGAGTQTPAIVKPARNWRMYERVSVSAFVDGGAWQTVLMHDFERDKAAERRVSHEEGVTVRRCGLKVELRMLVTAAFAGPGQRVVSKSAPGERIGLVQNCIERTGSHVFARTWVDLDDGWELGDSPMRISTRLIDDRAGERRGEPGLLGLRSAMPGTESSPPWYVTRARGTRYRVEPHRAWNEPGSVYVFESEPVERVRGRFYTTRSRFDFAKNTAFKNTSASPAGVWWAGFGPSPCPPHDCGFYPNEMVWGGAFIEG